MAEVHGNMLTHGQIPARARTKNAENGTICQPAWRKHYTRLLLECQDIVKPQKDLFPGQQLLYWAPLDAARGLCQYVADFGV